MRKMWYVWKMCGISNFPCPISFCFLSQSQEGDPSKAMELAKVKIQRDAMLSHEAYCKALRMHMVIAGPHDKSSNEMAEKVRLFTSVL